MEGLEPGPAAARPNDPRYCARHRAGAAFPGLGAGDPYRSSAVSAYLGRTDRIVALLAHAGLRVILDMHQDAYGSAFSEHRGPSPWNGEGAPPWATCTNGAAFAGRPYWGLAYAAPAVQTAIRHFWHNDVRGDLQGQFARVWQAVARHLRGDPDVLGYEVFNEPTDFSSADFSRDLQCAYAGPVRSPRSCAAGGVQALRTGLIGAIEAADRTHLVFVEPVVTAGLAPSRALGVAEPLRLGRLVLAVHLYGTPPAGMFGCPGIVCLNSERATLARLLADRARMRTRQPGRTADDDERVRRRTQHLRHRRGRGPRQRSVAVLELLVGAAAADPTGAPGENLLNDRTARPWPANPLGYDVAVQGAVVTSAPDASSLTLRPLPGNRRVAVLLAPPAANVGSGLSP